MSRSYKSRVISLVMLMLSVFSLSAVAAQDSLDDQPLYQMLVRIPDTPASRTEIYFNDRKAVEAAYPASRMPASWAEYISSDDARGKNADLLPLDIWWRIWRNQSSALSAQYLMVADETPDVVGFDYFQIEQEMTYGSPPTHTAQFAGRFDMDAVRAAFSNRDYVRQDEAGVEVWCSADGCENGAKINVRDRNPANLFGGHLGRSQPLLIEGNSLISSADEGVISSHVDVASGKAKSLADLPQYRAAVQAITADGPLMQAYFWDGELLAEMGVLSPGTFGLGERATPELLKRMFQDMLKDYEQLPMYQLLALADVATDTKQIGEVALVYTTEADAKTAAEILPKRIANYQSFVVKRSLVELLAERRVTEPVISVVDAGGSFVVLIQFATPKATPEEIQQFDLRNPDAVDVTAPGLIYRLLIDSAFRRDLGWLNTVPLSVLEEAAK